MYIVRRPFAQTCTKHGCKLVKDCIVKLCWPYAFLWRIEDIMAPWRLWRIISKVLYRLGLCRLYFSIHRARYISHQCWTVLERDQLLIFQLSPNSWWSFPALTGTKTIPASFLPHGLQFVPEEFPRPEERAPRFNGHQTGDWGIGIDSENRNKGKRVTFKYRFVVVFVDDCSCMRE